MYLLDTCVVSEWFRRQPSVSVLAWLDRIGIEQLHLSVVTVGELAQGVARVADPVKAEQLSSWLRRDVIARFTGRIMDVDSEAAMKWGLLRGTAMAQGRTLPAIDSLIAATALVHDMTVVTRNVADFERFGVRIANPWITA